MTERRKRYVIPPPISSKSLEDIAESIKIIQARIKCLHDSFAGYEPMLKQSLMNQKFWERVREHMAAGTAQSVVWAVVVGFFAMVGYSIHQYITNFVK
ncbi:MAG: hypothetical protein Q7N50_02885 [Armatimonadota bacterium]|nr:hypothetical protein [Armatimonadota bacterium]